MSSSMKLFDRGTTFLRKTVAGADYGPTDQYEGQHAIFYDFDYADRAAKISGMEVHAIVCRNDTGGNLLGGEMVTWTTAYVGRRAGAKTTDLVPTEGVAGIVDDFLADPNSAVGEGSAAVTVADGDLFWLIQKGPTRVINQDTQVSFTAGDYFTCDSGEDGRAMTFDDSQTGDAISIELSAVGRVLETNNASAEFFRVYADTGH